MPIIAESFHPVRDKPPEGSYWLVDPLDGTREFLSRNGEFTVNIALIAARDPVLGVVLVPALASYSPRAGAVGSAPRGRGRPPRDRSTATPAAGRRASSSRSHGDPESLARFFEGRPSPPGFGGVVAEVLPGGRRGGEAAPQFGRTMEWDIAAGDAVLRAAGGQGHRP